MFPSLKAGEVYTISIEAKDAQQNTGKASAQFEYKPRQVTLADGMDGKLMIPAVTQEFTHADGSKIIETVPLTLNDGSTVTGSMTCSPHCELTLRCRWLSTCASNRARP